MSKVLIVDDTKNIRMMLTTCLELEGYEVIQARDANEALDIFNRETIELAFFDIKMPEISGTELLRRIRANGIVIPVIIMTAFATVKNAIECTKLGAVAYLQKPFTSEKVKNILKEISNITEDKENIRYYLKLSQELIDTGKLEDALNILKKALSMEPTKGEIYYNLGKVHELRGDKEQAQKFYETSEIFGDLHASN